MKNAFTALALASVVAGGHAQEAASAPAPVSASTQNLSLRGAIAWQAKNVFRGIERSDTDGLIQSAVTLDYSAPGLSGVSIYGSFFNADAVERTYTVGLRRDFTQIDSNREAYAGVSLSNVAMKPSTYVYYSTELQQFTVEVAGSKTFAGSNVGLTGCDIVFRAYAGISDASTSVYATQNDYRYLGASLDVTRQIGRGPELGAGFSWAHNSDDQVLTAGSVFWGRVYAKFIF
jgi:hypothetical protein